MGFLPAVTSFINNGSLKALAVSTLERTPVMPDIPAMSETIEGFDVDSWYALFAPAGTPDYAVEKVQNALAETVKIPRVQEAFIAQGAVAIGSTPEELDEVVRREIPLWQELARTAGIRIN